MKKLTLLAASITAILSSNLALANTESNNELSNAELKQVIAEQKKAIAAIEKRLDETDEMLSATADQLESNTSNESVFSNTSIGGYGELHYNNYDNKDAKIDFHRFVLYFGHEFTDDIRFFSEFELEHSLVAGAEDGEDGAPGEIELEQAYIEVDINEKASTKVGLFLVPVGIMNETHEPPTFYGVERNNIEKYIVPTTWWEAGVLGNYKIMGGLSVDAAVTSGLFVGDDFKIRGGRQKVAQATAENLAFTSRISYTAIPGLKMAATVQYQSDLRQGEAGETADATLFETHATYQVSDFTVRALYARWDINSAEATAKGRDEQTGWYVEPSYKISEKIGVFARYGEYDEQVSSSNNTLVDSTSLGINYYLHENVVLKADFESIGNPVKGDSKGFNLGVGYQF